MKNNFRPQLLLRGILSIFAAAVGGGLAVLLLRDFRVLDGWLRVSAVVMVVICIGVALAAAGVCWLISPWLLRLTKRCVDTVERSLSDMPLEQLFASALGLILGLIVATLVTQLFRVWLPDPLFLGTAALRYLMVGYLFAAIGSRRWREVHTLFLGRQPRADRRTQELSAGDSRSAAGVPKILDTSVIIDGRIFDVCRTGFVEGPLVIPQFVLTELQRIADSSDPLRRNRGRRGLDVLGQLQNELDIAVQVTDMDFDDITEVDAKLLKLAQQSRGVVVTNDFNLNKVASVTGVKVLNLNGLAGALRPVLLPGEEMTVHILREGKEYGQGVGYLDDGTMIVVDNGKRFIGQTVSVVVTTVLQTSAGRMIFTRMKESA